MLRSVDRGCLDWFLPGIPITLYRIMITVSIDVTKMDKTRFYKGKKGTYVNLTLIESPNDQYGNTHLVVQSSTKEEREEGLKMPIIGNAKDFKILDEQKESGGYNAPQDNRPAEPEKAGLAQDDIPF